MILKLLALLAIGVKKSTNLNAIFTVMNVLGVIYAIICGCESLQLVIKINLKVFLDNLQPLNLTCTIGTFQKKSYLLLVTLAMVVLCHLDSGRLILRVSIFKQLFNRQRVDGGRRHLFLRLHRLRYDRHYRRRSEKPGQVHTSEYYLLITRYIHLLLWSVCRPDPDVALL